MAYKPLSSGELQFMKKLSHGQALDKLFEGKGVIRSGILITRIISLVNRGFLALDFSHPTGNLPRCVPTPAGEREVIRDMFEKDPFWSGA